MVNQYLFPVSNTSDSINTWYNQNGVTGNGYLAINEGTATPTDNDYLVYGSGSSSSVKITLGRLIVVPSGITLTHRLSGVGNITSILLRDTNNLTIASTTGVQSFSGSFTNRTVNLSGVNLDTRNYGNSNLLISFDNPSGVAISAVDMNVSGDINTLSASQTLFISSIRKAYFPPQFGEGGFNSGFSSGFGNDTDLMPFFVKGMGFSSGSLDLFLGQYNSTRLRPSGDSYIGSWFNSDNTTVNLWDYVNDSVDSSLSDNTYIYNYQSGVITNPSYLYWISDSGLFRSDLNGSGITSVDDSVLYSSATNGCYDVNHDIIYHGTEVGGTKTTYSVDSNGDITNTISSTFAGGLVYEPKDNYLYSLNKEGSFYKSTYNNFETSLAPLGGSFRDMSSRRLRLDRVNKKIYAVTQDNTSMLSRLYCYDIGVGTWSQVRILSHGIYGGAFDIDFDNSGIYYAATSGDLTSTAFYGIVLENMYSGVGTRVANPSASFFQCQELVLDSVHDKLYYVAQDNSGGNLQYKVIKTELDGSSPVTIHSLPEASGANVLLLNGPSFTSYIDFTLTDFSEDFGNPNNSAKQIAECYVAVKAESVAASGYAYLNAEILTGDKNTYIWKTINRGSGIYLGNSGILLDNIGYDNGYINSLNNTNVDWNNAVLRLKLSSYNPINSGDFRIYSTEAVLTSASNPVASSIINLYTYGKDICTNNLPLTTLAGAATKHINLYTIAASPASSGIDLNIIGSELASSGISLYTRAATLSEANLNLYLSVRTPQYISGEMSLITEGNDVPKGVKHLPLFVKVDGSDSGVYGKMNLYTAGYGSYDITSRMNLYINSTAPQSTGNIPLFVYNTRNFDSNNLTLYMASRSGVDGSQLASGSMNLFIERSIESDAHRMNLYISGPSGVATNTTLFITGANIFNSGIDLVIPNTIGSNIGTRTFYINGF